MKTRFLFLLFALHGLVLPVLGQTDTALLLPYKKGMALNEGIYITLDELRNNNPSIREFTLIADHIYGERGRILLFQACGDSLCEVKNCFGFYKSGSVYLSQGLPGYFYRIYLMGSLTHFIAFSSYGNRNRNAYSGQMFYSGIPDDFSEFILEIESGEVFVFNYKNFLAFLQRKDAELSQELKSSRRKRKMIYYYLLKYNERHPLFFPATP